MKQKSQRVDEMSKADKRNKKSKEIVVGPKVDGPEKKGDAKKIDVERVTNTLVDDDFENSYGKKLYLVYFVYS